SQYKCRQQLIWQYQAWLNETNLHVCEISNNCINQIAHKLKLLDGKEEIKKLLEVIKYLTQEREEQIYPDDVVDVFKTICELVQEKIILRKIFEGSKILSSNIIITGVASGVQVNANMQT
ncbi:13417_t:CDS:2, partial [Funneliformis geosporum]